MTLTLAIPNWNGASYLAATLASLNANGAAVRWWLQDGQSTDSSVSIAREHCREGDHIESAPDNGQTDALNRAFARMGGDIIGFINADDCLAPGAATAVLDYFARHPGIDLVYGEVEWLDEHGAVTGHHAGRIETLADVLDIYSVWWSQRQWVQPEVFFRRSLWERVGPFDTRYNLAFDYDYWVRCFLAGAKVGRLSRVLAQFRRHATQKSRASSEAAAEIRQIVEAHLPEAPIPRALAHRLRAGIDYDRYHLAEMHYANGKPSFLSYVARHPRALLLPCVRRRIRQSCGDRLRFPSRQ